MELTDKIKDYRGRFSKWHMKTLDERGKVITLLLTLSLATIGFITSQLMKADYNTIPTYIKVCVTTSFILLFLTVIIAIGLTLNRLKDFKDTTSILKARMHQEPNAIIKALKEENDNTGKNTIWLMNSMVVVFGFGELFAIASLYLYLTK